MEIVLLVLLGLTAGTLGSMLGLGGGFLVVPMLILLKDMDAKVATGTAVAVIVPTMLIALWRRGIQGHMDWRIAALVAVGSVGGAFLGSWLVERVDALFLRRLFAGVLVLLAGLLLLKR
jgi:uncharacterized membrane protein YfcA